MFVAEYFWNLCIHTFAFHRCNVQRGHIDTNHIYIMYIVFSQFSGGKITTTKRKVFQSHTYFIYTERVHCSAPQHQVLKVLFSVEKRQITNIQSKYSICVVYMNYLFKFSQVKHFFVHILYYCVKTSLRLWHEQIKKNHTQKNSLQF